ncbi:DUF1570 domain-containing protein [Planctomycetota bacterium]
MKSLLLSVFVLGGLLMTAVGLDAQGLSAAKLLANAEKAFGDKKWDKAKTIYAGLLEKHSTDDDIAGKLPLLRERVMRCDFYKDEYEFIKVFKEHTGVKDFKLKEGRIPFVEMKFTFDDKKEANMFSGGEVKGGGYIQKSPFFVLRIKFMDPFRMELKTEKLPKMGLVINLFGGTTYSGAMTNYTLQLGRGGQPPGMIWVDKKTLAERKSQGIEIQDSGSISLSKIRGKIQLKAGKLNISAADHKYKSGYIYFRSLHPQDIGLKIDEISIKAAVDPTWLTTLKTDLENSRWIKFKREYEKKYGKLPGPAAAEGESEGEEDDGKKSKSSNLNALALMVEALRVEVAKHSKEEITKYNECLAHFALRQYADAETKLTQLISAHTENYAGFLFRALVRLAGGKTKEANEDLDKAEELAGKIAYVPFMRGLIAMGKGKFEEGADFFKESFTNDESYVPAYIYRCMCLYRGDDIAAAEEEMKTYAAKFPGDKLMAAGNKMFYLLKNGPQWMNKYTAEGQHYTVHSEISQASADKVLKHIEAIFKEYNKFFPYSKKSKDKYKVFVFASYLSFADYSLDSGEVKPNPGIGGLYNPRLDHLLIRGDKEEAKMLGTVYHEGLHQYMEYHVKECPIWFNEGLATFFEASYFDNRGFRAGIVNKERLTVLEYALAGKLAHGDIKPLKRLMVMSPAEFMAGMGHPQKQQQVLVNYAHSWSVVYFMVRNPNIMKKVVRPYFIMLAEGKSREEAYQKTFAPKIATIEKLWKDYYIKKKYK